MKMWFLPALVGLGSGLLASMGMGGGFILLVYLAVFTDTDQLAAQGLNLFFFLPVIAVSVALHIKNKLIDVKTALVMGAAGAVTSVFGWLLAQQLQGALLRKCFAVFLIAVGLRDLFAKPAARQE